MPLDHMLTLSAFEEGANPHPLFPSTPRSYLVPLLLVFFFFFFLYVCKCSPTKSITSAFPLCIRLPSMVLCSSSTPWPLLLFASYLFVFFVLNKRFIFSKFAIMSENE
jgi:hypothetical protein